jgi:hypothetical protein
MPKVPFIVGPRIAREGEELSYKVQPTEAGATYRWTIPEGYSLATGSEFTDPGIKLLIGRNSSVLRVVAVNSEACVGVESRLNIEVRNTYAVGIYPTVISTARHLTIVPKNMQVNSLAVISTVGESYAYTKSGSFPLKSGVEMDIYVHGLPTGYYFFVFYGKEQSGPDEYEGRRVVHTERIVIKN